jgi:hypothetical protein
MKETELQVALRRLTEERKSPCADHQTITFWKSEVMRLKGAKA